MTQGKLKTSGRKWCHENAAWQLTKMVVMMSNLGFCLETNFIKQESDCFRTVRLFPDTIFQVYYTNCLSFLVNKQFSHVKFAY